MNRQICYRQQAISESTFKLKNKQVHLRATVYGDAVLNMDSDDVLSCADAPEKLDQRHLQRVYHAHPPSPLLSTLGSTIKIIHHCGT